MAGWDDSIFGNLPRPRRPGQDRPLNAQDIAAAGGVGTLAPANPSWSERLGGAFANAVDAVRGGGDREGWQNAYDISQKLAGLLPGVGQALSGNEAYRQGQQGNYGQAALAALGAVPIPGAKAAPLVEGAAENIAKAAVKTGITAYHGSPYDFDRFDISKIGTGEGAQAYGHGLYFAGNEDVAKQYRDQLAKGFSDAQGNPLPDETQRALEYIQPKFKASGDYAAGLQDAISRMQDQADFYRKQYDSGPNLYDSAAERLKAVDPNNLKPAGSMYQVNINADPDHFLDWDKSFGEQSPAVQSAVENLWLKRGNELGGDLPPFVRSEGRDTGQFIHNAIDAAYPQQGASSALQSEGVPGIKYLDQGSRGAGGEGGTQNYVTFSDDMIDILKKYGLAGALAPVGAGAATLSVMGQPGSGTTINSPPSNQQFY